MKLTSLQRRNLHALRAQQASGVRVWRILAQAKLAIVAHVLIGGGGAFYITQGGGWRTAGLLLVGFATGSYIRIIRTAIAASSAWPAFVAVIDWQKVETILRENESA